MRGWGDIFLVKKDAVSSQIHGGCVSATAKTASSIIIISNSAASSSSSSSSSSAAAAERVQQPSASASFPRLLLLLFPLLLLLARGWPLEVVPRFYTFLMGIGMNRTYCNSTIRFTSRLLFVVTALHSDFLRSIF